MNAQATTCQLIQPAVIIADCLRGLRALLASIIYTYDGKFRPVASLSSLIAVCVRKYIYDTIRAIPRAINTIGSVFSITTSLLTAVDIRRTYDFCNKDAATIAFVNNRASKANNPRSAWNPAGYWSGKHDYDAKDQQVTQLKQTRTQRR